LFQKMSNGDEEKFCLRWNDFESNISTAFRELKDDNDFFDVTLACKGEKQIQAHKVILSACSPFFKSVLKKNPHQHPLLYLKGVLYEEIASIVNFMYHGEVNVSQENLTSFLAVAEELQVKGLTQNREEQTKTFTKQQTKPNKSIEKVPDKGNPTIHPPTQKPRTIPSYQPGNPTCRNVQQIKTEEPVVVDCDPDEDISAVSMLDTNDYQDHTSGYDYDHAYEHQAYDDDQGQSPNFVQDAESLQNYSWKSGYTEKRNVTCDICFKTFSSKKSLNNHHGIHKGLTTCSVCQKVFATTSSLNLHIKNAHMTGQ